MKANISSFAAGLLFAAGLALAQMTQPSRIIGFLDFFGTWDPTLMFVIGGAVGTYMLMFRIIKGSRQKPVFTEQFQIPTRTDIDKSLVIGAAVFGAGWALGGFCPGPGIVASVSGALPALLFVGTMIIGMYLYDIFQKVTAK